MHTSTSVQEVLREVSSLLVSVGVPLESQNTLTKATERGWEMSELVKHLLYRHEDLSSDPNTCQSASVVPAGGKGQRQADPLKFTGQPA